ncbi:MAG: hypothetical protein ABW007_11600 [Chitinophagaceae bacterium]
MCIYRVNQQFTCFNANTQLKGGAEETAAYVDVVMALLNTDEFITRK